MKLKINLQALLAVALVVSIAGNIYGFVQHRQVSTAVAESQQLTASLQKKINALEQRSIPSQESVSRLSREEYLERRAAQQRKQSSLSRLAAQRQTTESHMAPVGREDVQRRQQGSVQAIQ